MAFYLIMIFSLLITSPPTSATSHSAYQFAKAVLAQGHSLYRVFFYQDGAYHGSALCCPPQDEWDIIAAWRHLQVDHSVNMVVCISASLKRGILDSHEAKRLDKQGPTLCPEFELAGLGQLIDATHHSDRIITFGG